MAAWDTAQVAYEQSQSTVDATYREAETAARAIRDKTQDAATKAKAAFNMARDSAYDETETKYIAIFAAGRDVSGYRRENVLEMALSQRKICPE